MTDTIRQKLLKYIQKSYDDTQYDKGPITWIWRISFFLSFLFPMYLLSTDQVELLGKILIFVSPIGLYCWHAIDSRKKYKLSILRYEVYGFISVNFAIFAISTMMCLMAVADKMEMDQKIKANCILKEINHD